MQIFQDLEKLFTIPGERLPKSKHLRKVKNEHSRKPESACFVEDFSFYFT